MEVSDYDLFLYIILAETEENHNSLS